MQATSRPSTIAHCYHCGESCHAGHFAVEEKSFCCAGCRSVYELLSAGNLCQYYKLEQRPGHIPNLIESGKWAVLDDAQVASALLRFSNSTLCIATLQVPGMHCASCIFLLEQLHRLVPGVQSATVDFLRKEVTIRFNPTAVSLRQVVEKMEAIGYLKKFAHSAGLASFLSCF